MISSLDSGARFLCELTSNKSISFGMRIKRELNKQIIKNAKKEYQNRNRFIISAIEYYLKNKNGVLNK